MYITINHITTYIKTQAMFIQFTRVSNELSF